MEIVIMPSLSIDDAYNELQKAAKEHGCLCWCDFNGVTMYSCETLDNFYKKLRAAQKEHKSGDCTLTLNEYQRMALETAVYPEEFRVIYPALGMNGEAGEVADKVKKIIRDKNCVATEEDKIELAKECGDVLWYIATLANDLGYSLEDIGRMNYEKLKSRQERNKIGGNGDNR